MTYQLDGGGGGAARRRPQRSIAGIIGSRNTRPGTMRQTSVPSIASMVETTSTATPVGAYGPMAGGYAGRTPAGQANVAQSLAAPSGGGGGGGGGGAAPAPAPPAMSLQDFIRDNFMIRQAENEGARMLEDFDSETQLMRGETEAEQEMRRGDLQNWFGDAANENAGSFAARGLERSGLVFQEQDRLNEEQARRSSMIDEMLTDLLSNRQRGRQDQQRNAQRLINDRIAQATQQFNQLNSGQVAI